MSDEGSYQRDALKRMRRGTYALFDDGILLNLPSPPIATDERIPWQWPPPATFDTGFAETFSEDDALAVYRSVSGYDALPRIVSAGANQWGNWTSRVRGPWWHTPIAWAIALWAAWRAWRR